MRRTVEVLWHCCHNVRWNGFFAEPDECNTEFKTTETLLDWNDGAVYATCPSCGAELNVDDDEPEMRILPGK